MEANRRTDKKHFLETFFSNAWEILLRRKLGHTGKCMYCNWCEMNEKTHKTQENKMLSSLYALAISKVNRAWTIRIISICVALPKVAKARKVVNFVVQNCRHICPQTLPMYTNLKDLWMCLISSLILCINWQCLIISLPKGCHNILRNNIQHNDIQHNNTAYLHNNKKRYTRHNGRMLLCCVFYADCHVCWVRRLVLYAECHYAEYYWTECHYAEYSWAECRYAECRGALKSSLIVLLVALAG